jgi:hypothetical protein
VEFSKLLSNLIDGYVTHIKSYDDYVVVVIMVAGGEGGGWLG